MQDISGVADRFWKKVDRRGADECWPWLAMVSIDGHGKFQVGNRNVMAHRIAYRLTCGEIPAGLVVRHTCDHADCVNPGHLLLGTVRQNNADRKARGRYLGHKPIPRQRLAERQRQRRGVEPGDVLARFMASFKVADSGCWEWQKARLHFGHGAITVAGKQRKAHRLAYELLVGPIPDGLHILHSCDNPCCVNPQHLRAGTHAENMAERDARGRVATGTRNHFGRVIYRGNQVKRAVLTEDAVRQIRNSATPYVIGKTFGVSKGAIAHVLARRCWKHVD